MFLAVRFLFTLGCNVVGQVGHSDETGVGWFIAYDLKEYNTLHRHVGAYDLQECTPWHKLVFTRDHRDSTAAIGL